MTRVYVMGRRDGGERKGELTGELRQRAGRLQREMLACIIGLSALRETSLRTKQGKKAERIAADHRSGGHGKAGATRALKPLVVSRANAG